MYNAIYKCRLCKEKFYDEKDSAEKLSNFGITNILAQNEPVEIPRKPHCIDLHKFHNCEDGSYGFADFRGFEKVEK
ncbi:MAG: hypothetical protein NC548_62125 [Lachnospiraceae bacterium]|nr:hypothetical protein [Lachnospiraceae bacterium]